MKTPTLAIVCNRKLEMRDFVPVTYFEIVATAQVAAGKFQMRHAPQDRILKRENAEIAAKVDRELVQTARDLELAARNERPREARHELSHRQRRLIL